MNLIIYYDKSLIQFDLTCELSPNSPQPQPSQIISHDFVSYFSWFPGKEKKKEE